MLLPAIVTRARRGQRHRDKRCEAPLGRGDTSHRRSSAEQSKKGPAVATERRRDLQGVRALAVLLVALNHANVPFLPGGYIGVDVFFVLSGYFITGLVLREGLGREGVQGSGKVSISKFYARRARRILPCASWYRWAIQQDRELHPTATLVTFKLSGDYLESHPDTAVADLRTVLSQVDNGFWLEDAPRQTKQTATCITATGATQRSCSSPVTSSYTNLLQDIQTMLSQTHRPSIPTLQWFCAACSPGLDEGGGGVGGPDSGRLLLATRLRVGL
jgi:hypothetical protein